MTADEILKVYEALRVAKRFAKEIGTDAEYEKMVEAYDIIGVQPLPSMYATQEKRDAGHMKWTADQCATYGAD